jgi:DNA polymerase III subunit gamma/tau
MAQNYRALTRTYRPQSFDDIVSQEHVSSTLKNAIKQNRISHAYMFCGPRGVGKTTMARVLARAVNEVSDDVDGEALNQTLNIVEMDAASNRKIEDVRQLKDVIRVPPQSGKYKIFIIDEVHMLTKEAFNALLKTLEEPPPHAIFIFATTEPHKVLPTILSRVQRFDFKRISVDEIISRLKQICLKEQITIDDESLHVIAKKADGALRDALGLMDQAVAFCGMEIRYSELLQALNVIGNDHLFDFTDAIAKRDSNTGLTLIDDLMKEGADIQEFLVSLTEHIRNLYVAKQGDKMHLVEATAETKDRYKKIAVLFSEEDLMRMLHLVCEAQLKNKDVQQPRVHFEILMLKLIHMSRSKELNELISGLELLKKNGRIPLAKEESKTSQQSEELSHEKEETDDESSGPYTKDAEISEPVNRSTPQTESTPSVPSITASKESQNGRSTHQTTVSEAVQDEDEEEDMLMGRPSLGFARGISSTNGREETAADLNTETAQHTSKIELNGTDDIEAHWKPFLDVVKESAPQMLYFQMLRVQLKDLRGTELIVSADNEFATNLMDENQQMLSSFFKQVTGVHIRIKCIVERDEKKEKESLSPYERFKELQKKDPQLRTIVELFGAELEY